MSEHPTAENDVDDAVRERLLKAWRGEIKARQTYELIARRLPQREAEIMARMADAEASHRQRLEARMRELGIEVPPAAGVRLSWFARMQARLAPVERLLAAREAAENDEVGGLYKHPTGDPTTDALLQAIRAEEQAHSTTVADMRSGEREAQAPELTPGQRHAKARLGRREIGPAPARCSRQPPHQVERLRVVVARASFEGAAGDHLVDHLLALLASDDRERPARELTYAPS